MTQIPAGFIRINAPNPHHARMKEITSKYPEVKSLFGYTRLTAVYALLIIAFQFVIAYFLKDQSLWLIF
ncbi:MAG: fatty acid desaturase, partial [Deltaproteobacteria bacterium]|nr:fatty acid desaturase [Deltaproteobacteria bacterium]